ncbi:TIGR03619 family F420-dependent LLM class oxidoreductase [Actinoallomurus rhizosphaericola]|uniref:TIGR03619 family F420-dependent LLM class oxidoreductase n=1 Tax=Actinoallomurus rhizosphaericola TaxID=2952536 RepID=UPI00209076E1|nr:TIGR03619 family F420-dependent LLM class oxidoreductase [Actinoallomurus rhizosphaericola]MCO5992238.1 TIGR03619 family F420-dependent LLM class oxidoreductase [Actinoallomurus rhizosphaericola]
MRFGVPLGLVHPGVWRDLAVEADRLGFESVWMPEHLVFATDLSTAAYPGTGRPGIVPSTPLFDAPAHLCALAAVTERIRLGTAVYLFALRHPFVAARAFATLDHVSGGRAVAGVGAGWYAGEWRAAGVDFASRGRRLDEAIDVARRLWTEDVVEHHGEFFDFDEVAFEPKPRGIPILAGGESAAALCRAATRCDGWIGMPHTLESVRPLLDRLRRHLAGRDRPFEITVHAYELAGPEEVGAWAALGVDRLIVRPWTRTREALDGLRGFAAEYGITGR